jgi:hypothetical protein
MNEGMGRANTFFLVRASRKKDGWYTGGEKMAKAILVHGFVVQAFE